VIGALVPADGDLGKVTELVRELDWAIVAAAPRGEAALR
jgi:hypothetical protein